MRVGHGYDVHRFGEGDAVTLGGVRIPHVKSLVAHSDGDVALHALCDALLGALALGDIGKHFPDTDPAYRNADSVDLLKRVYALVIARNFRLQNADITVLAEQPKLAPHIPRMQAIIAQALQVTTGEISIKATTSEKIGFIGREEGIAAYAVVLLSAT
ncbi:MAG TPA: 2-C-methyl-D-erythritol 2,4-cyclodiphosphate synthase [Gammaproteobacteria bacterium]|nr:2-C-methyl-D-erythritol 2,4-cyclodiphosphate synthase [Gammaproteobacteria bacterium]